MSTARARLQRIVTAFDSRDTQVVLQELHSLSGEAGLLGMVETGRATADAHAIAKRWAGPEHDGDLEFTLAQALRVLARTVDAIETNTTETTTPLPVAERNRRGLVLIVDDSGVALERMCAALTDDGFDTRGCADTCTALDSIEAARPQVVLLDLSVAGVDSLCAAIRRLQPTPTVVLSSAQSDDELAAHAVRLGANSFVSKHDGVTRLVEHVRALGSDAATKNASESSGPPPSSTPPPSLMSRFRTLSDHRLARIEACWEAATHGVEADAASDALRRELHTLTGDARLLGFSHTALISEKLEGLVTLARGLGYDVPIELDLIVGMTTRLLALLLREDTRPTGMDLTGFAAALDDIVNVTNGETISRSTTQEIRERLATVLAQATERLHSRAPVALAPLLEGRAMAISALAREAGKRAEAVLAIGELQVTEDIADAVEMAATHLMRNSIAHGIETPQDRAASGKPAAGTVWVRAAKAGDLVEVEIEDDGRGIDTVAVKTRAVRSGLLTEAEAALATEADLLPLLFEHGFSTKEHVDDLAGRGIGLDAVKTAVERVGGTISVSTHCGRGTTFRMSIPERNH